MDILEIFELENLKVVRDNQELVTKRLTEREPHMVTTLKMVMQGFEIYSFGLLLAIKEYQNLKNELMNEGSLWYLNSELSARRETKNKLQKEYENIRLDVEKVCEKALIIADLKEIA